MARPLKSSASYGSRQSEWLELAPSEGLGGVVAAAWTGSAGGWSRPLRLLPDGCADLVWDGRRLTFFRPVDRPLHGHLLAETRNIGLRLECGFAGVVFASLHCLQHDAERTLPKIRESERRLEVLQQLVAKHLPPRPGDPSTLAAVAAIRGGAAVSEAAAASGLELRELRRRFASAVGLSPKRLQRVLRFDRLRAEVGSGLAAARLAGELGYADQAHMIRECRRLSGSTPGQLARTLDA